MHNLIWLDHSQTYRHLSIACFHPAGIWKGVEQRHGAQPERSMDYSLQSDCHRARDSRVLPEGTRARHNVSYILLLGSCNHHCHQSVGSY